MAYSSSSDFSITRDDIIKTALRIVKALPPDDDPTGLSISVTPAITNAATILNMMVKSWQSDDIGVWLNKELTLFLDTTSDSYTLGTGTTDNLIYTSSLVETALGADMDETDTDLTVDSITGISDSDIIGIQLDDGTMQWSTVNGTPSGTTVVIDDALDDDAAEDNKVFVYTTETIPRPLDIIEARHRDINGNDIELFLAGHLDYARFNDKGSTGTPHSIFYDKQIADGVLYVYPISDSSLSRIVMTVKTLVYDFNASTDTAHFPIEWSNALKWGLAAELIADYGHNLDSGRIQYIMAMAQRYLASAKGGDAGSGTVRIVPDLRRMR